MLNSIENRAQIAQSRRILEACAAETATYDVNIVSHLFEVHPRVFSPKYFGSTPIFSRFMPYRQNDTFLEIGSGIGATAILAAKNGAERVVAVDINPAAVENTRRNAARHGVSHLLDARYSDVFSMIRASETFDTIYWNMPFIYVSESYKFRSVLERALFDPGYNITRNFLTDCRRFLRRDGRVVVGFGDFGETDKLIDLAAEAGFTVREIAREQSQEGGPVQFILYELTQKAD